MSVQVRASLIVTGKDDAEVDAILQTLREGEILIPGARVHLSETSRELVDD